MGIVGFLKSLVGARRPTAPQGQVPQEAAYKALEITPSDDVFDCYDAVFDQAMAKVSGIPSEDVDAIKDYIMAVEGGFLNAHGYYEHVWENYFEGRSWRWLEHEEWLSVFSELGRFPLNFPQPAPSQRPSVSSLLQRMKVADLKLLCKCCSVSFTSKTNKAQLTGVLELIPNIEKQPQLQVIASQINSEAKRSLYSLLMRTIQFRAMSLHNKRRAHAIGVTDFRVMHTFEQDREFVELAWRRVPDGLPPLFPGDMSGLRSVIPSFDS
ncbi:hypothetical protein [Stenotrophomonas maltophilia]|uniref:hypothetical protein n=1 Tax=Stenotrophomonas maltophilia TaxID=40324 RepID=UPI0013D9C1FC|nr:hypothetical protein [Stenotrophomonas maltophilia]